MNYLINAIFGEKIRVQVGAMTISKCSAILHALRRRRLPVLPSRHCRTARATAVPRSNAVSAAAALTRKNGTRNFVFCRDSAKPTERFDQSLFTAGICPVPHVFVVDGRPVRRQFDCVSMPQQSDV